MATDFGLPEEIDISEEIADNPHIEKTVEEMRRQGADDATIRDFIESQLPGVLEEKEAAAFLAPKTKMLDEGYQTIQDQRAAAMKAAEDAPEAIAAAGTAREGAARAYAAQNLAAAMQGAAGQGVPTGGGMAAAGRAAAQAVSQQVGDIEAATLRDKADAELQKQTFLRSLGTQAEDYMEAVKMHGETIQSHQADWASRRANTGKSAKDFKKDHKASWEKMIDDLINNEMDPYVRQWLAVMRESFGKTYPEAAAAAFKASSPKT